MKIYISCEKCKFNISPDMKYSFENGICPNCGSKIEVGDIPSVSLLIQTVLELNLPLSGKQLMSLINTFLKEKLNMNFPEIYIIDEPKDIIRSETNKTIRSLKTKNNESKLEDKNDKNNTYSDNNQNNDDNNVVSVSESEINQIKNDLNSPIANLPNPKEFNESGILFVDPNKLSRTPILHKEFKRKGV